MEIKIGVQHSPRELLIDSQDSQQQVEDAVAAAIADGSPLTLTDQRGRRIVVPGDKIAYAEIGGGVSGNVGFR